MNDKQAGKSAADVALKRIKDDKYFDEICDCLKDDISLSLIGNLGQLIF